jgi:hypothetical protein
MPDFCANPANGVATFKINHAANLASIKTRMPGNLATRPREVILRPRNAIDTGTFAVDGPIATVRWTTGSVEGFVKTPAPDEQMAGTWNETEPLIAKRL